MKRTTALLLSLLTPVAALLIPASAGALAITVSASASSAVADNSSTITFTVSETEVPLPQNGHPAGCDEFHPYAGGSGNTLDPTLLELSYTSDGTCTGTFTLKSSAAETKTVGVNVNTGKDGYQPRGNTVDVAFTAVSVPKPAATPKPTATTSTPAPAPAPAPTPPAAPTTGLKLDNQIVTTTTTTPSVQSGKAITLSGATVPNGVVTLYIFSTPRQASVTADAQGNWTYQITNLGAGSHHVEATVTDPATTLTSDRVTLAKFTIAKPAAAASTVAAKKTTPLWIWAVVGLATLGLIAGGVFWWWRKRNHKNTTLPPQAGIPPQPPLPPQPIV